MKAAGTVRENDRSQRKKTVEDYKTVPLCPLLRSAFRCFPPSEATERCQMAVKRDGMAELTRKACKKAESLESNQHMYELGG